MPDEPVEIPSFVSARHGEYADGAFESLSADINETESADAAASDISKALPAPDQRNAWVEVDRDAIRSNLKAIRKHIGASPYIMAVVKADGYGHGAVEVAKVALANGATYLGVATVQEGVELRRAGIEAPILVLSQPPKDTIPFILQHNIITTGYTSDFLMELGEQADRMGMVAPFHLKIDTGMHRIGVPWQEAAELLQSISFHRALELQGVFTHFATADEIDTFGVRMQLDRFNQAIEAIKYAGIRPGIIHAANSAAAIRFKETHFNMVRIGIAMYGMHPSNETRKHITLTPAMSVHAKVSRILPVQVGEGVSYGFTYRSPGNVQIATIPIGYGDGLSRALSNRMQVLVAGREYPQVGNICMDMCMFEVDERSTALKPRAEINEGDEVVLIGRSGDYELTLDDLANELGTINYDIACRFGLRLPRYYVN
jgi:alanine racemase